MSKEAGKAKYSVKLRDAAPVNPRNCSVWIVYYREKPVRILACEPSLDVYQVLAIARQNYKHPGHVSVASVAVGDFRISSVVGYAQTDPRRFKRIGKFVKVGVPIEEDDEDLI
jgi:hypothetical protein